MDGINYTKQELKLVEKMTNKLEKRQKSCQLSTKEYTVLEIKLFVRYFGRKPKRCESRKLTNLRYSLIRKAYAINTQNGESKSIVMEKWCEKWDKYVIELNKEGAWLFSQIQNHSIDYNDAINGKYELPKDLNPILPEKPLYNLTIN